MKKYAGIGSRRTPENVLDIMSQLGEALAKQDWLLRSGGADGADSAFEKGSDEAEGKKEIFLPWERFNGNESPLVINKEHAWAHDLAAQTFPWIPNQKESVRNLIGRNMMQVLGIDGNDPVDMVICWTDSDKGGTNYALTIAKDRDIPIRNLYKEEAMQNAKRFLEEFSHPL